MAVAADATEITAAAVVVAAADTTAAAVAVEITAAADDATAGVVAEAAVETAADDADPMAPIPTAIIARTSNPTKTATRCR